MKKLFCLAALVGLIGASVADAGIRRERHCYHCRHGHCVKRDVVVTGPDKKSKAPAPVAPAPNAVPAPKVGTTKAGIICDGPFCR